MDQLRAAIPDIEVVDRSRVPRVHTSHGYPDPETYARIWNAGYDASHAQWMADDPEMHETADDWLAAKQRDAVRVALAVVLDEVQAGGNELTVEAYEAHAAAVAKIEHAIAMLNANEEEQHG